MTLCFLPFAAVLRQSNIPCLHVLLMTSLKCNLHAVTLFSFGRRFGKFTPRVFLLRKTTPISVGLLSFSKFIFQQGRIRLGISCLAGNFEVRVQSSFCAGENNRSRQYEEDPSEESCEVSFWQYLGFRDRDQAFCVL